MHKFNGVLNIDGSLAYVPQQAWIQNATLKNNILFQKPYQESFYNEVLDACALRTDLNILPAGDETEIGEKGINMSGGQKQRVSLARAVYSSADIYILDDPLSAVDAHVGKHIFNKVISRKGMIKKKTRIFATNSINFLAQCDRVIMLDQGIIVANGTYDELKDNNELFSKFVGQYLQNEENNNNNKEEEDNSKKFESQLSKEKNKSNNETEKIGEKIIAKEKVETGKVKLSIILDYFKSSSIKFTIISIVLYALMNAAQAGTSAWLSDWSEKSEKEPDNEKLKYVGLGVYTALGVLQCI
jgi:ABC-type multidrug transport system ATPase subunit